MANRKPHTFNKFTVEKWQEMLANFNDNAPHSPRVLERRAAIDEYRKTLTKPHDRQSASAQRAR
jgi:hypothetical protein